MNIHDGHIRSSGYLEYNPGRLEQKVVMLFENELGELNTYLTAGWKIVQRPVASNQNYSFLIVLERYVYE